MVRHENCTFVDRASESDRPPDPSRSLAGTAGGRKRRHGSPRRGPQKRSGPAPLARASRPATPQVERSGSGTSLFAVPPCLSTLLVLFSRDLPKQGLLILWRRRKVFFGAGAEHRVEHLVAVPEDVNFAAVKVRALDNVIFHVFGYDYG